MIDNGDVITLSVMITDDADQLANAGAITCTVTLPDGTTDTPSVTNPSVGVYEAIYATVQAGRHLVRWLATGLNASADVEVFDVREVDWPAIVSLADTKSQLRIAADKTDHDEDLRRFIEAATHVIEGYVGAVVRRTVTQTASGSGPTLVLHTRPVLSVTSVEEDGNVLDSSSWSLSDAGVLTRVSGGQRRDWARGVKNIAVEYIVGRPVIPANFTLAAQIHIQHLWETRRGSHGSPRFGGSTQTSKYGGVDDPLLEKAVVYSVTRRVVELLEKDMTPGGIA